MRKNAWGGARVRPGSKACGIHGNFVHPRVNSLVQLDAWCQLCSCSSCYWHCCRSLATVEPAPTTPPLSRSSSSRANWTSIVPPQPSMPRPNAAWTPRETSLRPSSAPLSTPVGTAREETIRPVPPSTATPRQVGCLVQSQIVGTLRRSW